MKKRLNPRLDPLDERLKVPEKTQIYQHPMTLYQRMKIANSYRCKEAWNNHLKEKYGKLAKQGDKNVSSK